MVPHRRVQRERHRYIQEIEAAGGRASELVVLGQGSTGAANDLAKATELATKMVREFGLSSTIGPVVSQSDRNTRATD